MSETFTVEYVRTKLQLERESDEPDAILDVLKANAGKKFNVHLLRKLPGGEERWRYYHIAGMTSLEDRAYRAEGVQGISLLLSYDSSGPHTVAPDFVVEKNPAYFAGRRDRNGLRTHCAESPRLCQEMADALAGYVQAREALAAARAKLDALSAYGKPFSPDEYTWQRLCGAYEDDNKGKR